MMSVFTAVSTACSVILTIWVLELGSNEDYLKEHTNKSATVAMSLIVVPLMLLMWLLPASTAWRLKEERSSVHKSDNRVCCFLKKQ
jgi:hypothetical protein